MRPPSCMVFWFYRVARWFYGMASGSCRLVRGFCGILCRFCGVVKRFCDRRVLRLSAVVAPTAVTVSAHRLTSLHSAWNSVAQPLPSIRIGSPAMPKNA